MNLYYGKYNDINSQWKHNTKDATNRFLNQVTRRNKQALDCMHSRRPSSNIVSAGLKSLRLYRHICRMIPYLIKIHEIQHRTTPEQAKMFMGNHFRANAHITDLIDIDFKVDIGYEMLSDAQWHYSQTGYLYKYLMSPKGILNDHGLDRFDDYRAQKLNRKGEASPFLKKFYKGYKSAQI